jgi:hypothetical protein
MKSHNRDVLSERTVFLFKATEGSCLLKYYACRDDQLRPLPGVSDFVRVGICAWVFIMWILQSDVWISGSRTLSPFGSLYPSAGSPMWPPEYQTDRSNIAPLSTRLIIILIHLRETMKRWTVSLTGNRIAILCNIRICDRKLCLFIFCNRKK